MNKGYHVAEELTRKVWDKSCVEMICSFIFVICGKMPEYYVYIIENINMKSYNK